MKICSRNTSKKKSISACLSHNHTLKESIQIDVLEVNTCKTTAMFPLQTVFSSENYNIDIQALVPMEKTRRKKIFTMYFSILQKKKNTLLQKSSVYKRKSAMYSSTIQGEKRSG